MGLKKKLHFQGRQSFQVAAQPPQDAEPTGSPEPAWREATRHPVLGDSLSFAAFEAFGPDRRASWNGTWPKRSRPLNWCANRVAAPFLNPIGRQRGLQLSGGHESVPQDSRSARAGSVLLPKVPRPPKADVYPTSGFSRQAGRRRVCARKPGAWRLDRLQPLVG